jgi:hypothetical protein
LRSLTPKRFKYDERMGRGDEEFVGFVYQDVEGTPLGDFMCFRDESYACRMRTETYEAQEEYQEAYNVVIPATTQFPSTTERRLRTLTRTVTKERQVPDEFTLPGGIGSLNTTALTYAMLNALKELDQRLTAGGL